MSSARRCPTTAAPILKLQQEVKKKKKAMKAKKNKEALSDAGRLTLCVRRARHVCASARGASRRLRASLVAQWGVRGA